MPSQLHSEPLESMVVTADRLEWSILSSGDLELFQTESVTDLPGLVPGLCVVTSDTRGYGDVMSMRGVANTLLFSPPAVGMVVDDVPLGDAYSYPAGLLEMEEIKVLRDPRVPPTGGFRMR